MTDRLYGNIAGSLYNRDLCLCSVYLLHVSDQKTTHNWRLSVPLLSLYITNEQEVWVSFTHTNAMCWVPPNVDRFARISAFLFLSSFFQTCTCHLLRVQELTYWISHSQPRHLTLFYRPPLASGWKCSRHPPSAFSVLPSWDLPLF